MANTKKRKSNKNKYKKRRIMALIIVTIVLAGLGGGAFYVYKNWKSIMYKAEDFLPNGFTYPTEYEEFVLKYSNKYEVDPVLIFSVIRTESGFDPNAESEVGARGLMQLMSDAFEWVKFRLNDERDIDFNSMYDPETNIQYGSYYLSYLMEKYDNSIELSAAAYHCGMGMVDCWLEDGTVDAENFNVDDIPAENDQTAEYVKRIDKAYENYSDVLSSTGNLEQ